MASRHIILPLLFLLLGFGNVQGQTRKYSFDQLSEEHGLSQNFIYSLSQDDRGFLWIGTGQGLSRYDGDEIKKFTTKDSLNADFVTADLRTASGNLVFGHYQGGVTLFDGLRFHPLLPDTLGTKVVSVTEDGNHNLWVATQSEGLIFIPAERTDITVHRPAELSGQIIQVACIFADRLWVGTLEGLFVFRIMGNKLVAEQHDLVPPYTGVTSILPHHIEPDLIWVGTAFRGLILLKSDHSGVRVQRSFKIRELQGTIIQAIAQDADGDLWLGTRHNGVMYLNIARNQQSVFKVKYFRTATGFPLTSVNKLIIDRQGQIWAGTMGNGLVKIYKELFTYFAFREKFGVKEVRAIAEYPSGYLVATDIGLIRIQRDDQSDEYSAEVADFLKNESILSVFTDRNQQTWMATEGRGVFMLTPEGELQHVPVDPGNNSVEVRLFEEDLKGNMWMSAKGQGVYVLNPDRKPLQHLTTANRFVHNDVFAIKADSRGNMWFGTYAAGLARLNERGELDLFSKIDSLRSRDINDIDEDDSGNIWIATEGDGFFKYSDSDSVFSKVGGTETLLSPFIKGIQYDPTGRIWFSYRKGLGYYDLESEKKYHFTAEDGLIATEAYSSAIIVDSKANKWFCNDYGVTLFEHDTLTERTGVLETYLTGIRIFFKDYPVQLQEAEAFRGSLVGKLPPLTLTHEDNHITFDFVAIKLKRSGEIYYRHQLEGYDAGWTPPEAVNFVTYTNLDPGKYVFKIQATDDLGAWVDPVTEYAFVIEPPYWKRTWFYLLQIFSVVALFSLTYFIGKKGISTKRYVLRLMLFSSFFITLEYVENFVDPLVSDFFGGAPVFRFFLNFVLALLLLPVETLITHWLMDDPKPVDQVHAATPDSAPEEVIVEDDN